MIGDDSCAEGAWNAPGPLTRTWGNVVLSLFDLGSERRTKNRFVKVDVFAHDHVSRQNKREIFAVFAEVGPRLSEEPLVLTSIAVLNLDFSGLRFHMRLL